MARQYSSKDFFRHVPKALLGRYFAARGVLGELDFASMKEGQPDALFEAWLALAEEPRRGMEADFREISELSTKAGFLALRDEAQFHLGQQPEHLVALTEKLAGQPDHHARAMLAFLDHPELWKGALLFHRADGLVYWRKRKNLPRKAAAVDPASLEKLAEMIKGYFRATDGRGKNCVVEPYRRGERDYFFAYPEDHSQRSIEWVDGKFDPRPHNPAFEIVFVYSQADGTLDLNARGVGKGIEALQGIFAQAILKLEDLPPDPKDERVYDLGPLVRRDFAFTPAPGSGIGTVVVKRVRLSSRVRGGDRLTIEADSTANRQAVHELMEQVGKSVPLHLYNVTQVDVAATVMTDPARPPKTMTFRITHPNSCSLKYDEMDLKLRQMLEASGIEPRVPEQAAALAVTSMEQAGASNAAG